MTTARSTLFLLAATLLGSLTACGKNPYAITWTANPDTVLLYSLARPELNLPSAFDFYPSTRHRVAVEAAGSTGGWDLALDTRNDTLVFRTPESLGADSRAAIASFPGLSLDELTEAPADTTVYSFEEPVPVETGTSYVVRTRSSSDVYGQQCWYYAELTPLEVDPGVGTVRFVYDVDPRCNDRKLVPDKPAP